MRSYVFVLVAVALGCGSDQGGPGSPTTGSLVVRTVTSGTVPPDGYTYRLDGLPAQPIGSNTSATQADVEPGAHVVQLASLPDGCSISGDNPQTVGVSQGATAVAEFAVTCVPPAGAIQVTTTSSGSPPTGYDLVLDGVATGTIGSSATRTLENLPSGNHEVGLSGLPANCELQGENPVTTTVRTGATTAISLSVACAPPPAETGTLVIATATSGEDPNGYRVSVDAGARQPIASAGSLTLSNVAVGEHSVRLFGMAIGCATADANPRRVAVTAGATVTVPFNVTCAPPPTVGTIRVITSTSGASPNDQGYLLAVDAGTPQAIGTGATLTLDSVAVGTHTLTLSGIPDTCALDGTGSRTVALAGGATVEVRFLVRCAAVTIGQWNRMESGTTFSLYSVWGSSATDVFTVGEPGGQFESGIFHFDGQTWTTQSTQTGVTLYGIWGSGPTDVFAVGSSPLGTLGYNGVLLHFDGSTWSQTTPPPLGNDGTTETSYYAVWGSSSTDVFAAGESNNGFSQARIAHFDGTAWSDMVLPARDDRVLADVFGTSGQDVYAVGYFDAGPSVRRGAVRHSAPRSGSLRFFTDGVILHYDGTAWVDAPVDGTGAAFYGVWASAPNDVFAVGAANDAASIYHYDGTAWTPMAVPPVGPLLDVWGTSAADVYAVGAGTMLHYDGQAWTEVQSVLQRLAGVWGSSAGDVFTVGSGGTIIRGSVNVSTASR